jgi:hypothetical protein
MNFLRSRKELSEEIWALCELVSPKIYKDMQRVALMEPFDPVYFKQEFQKLSSDFAVISVFGLQLDHPNRVNWKSLTDHWRKLRNIVAIYIDKSEMTKIDKIDNHSHFILHRLPKITYNPDQRPRKSLPREWWDNHPDREASLENIGLNWWRMASLPEYTYEDFAVEEAVEAVQDEGEEVRDSGEDEVIRNPKTEMMRPGRPGCVEGRLIEVD